MHRVAYELQVVHIDLSVDSTDIPKSNDLLKEYESRFPRHKYSYLRLDEALQLNGIDWDALGVLKSNPYPAEVTNKRSLQEIVGSISTATSRADIISTLLTRLLVDVAKRNNCEAILFGDSTTRLAERTLTETAKGRGFSLPWQVSDGRSPYGVVFNYPLRDLLKKELVTFTHLSTTLLAEVVVYPPTSSQVSASAKTTTIDDLMAHYFASVEQNYPSIVANVVRTSSKLNAATPNAPSCGFCGLPVEEGTSGISGWGGDQEELAQEKNQENVLCYGCSRSMHG